MSDALLSDLEKLVEKHKKAESPLRECWIPICEHYKTAISAAVYDVQGGDIISVGKNGHQRKVLFWARVQINPDILLCKVLDTVRAQPHPPKDANE